MLQFDVDVSRPSGEEAFAKGGAGTIFSGWLINPYLIQKFGGAEVAMKLSSSSSAGGGGMDKAADKFELALISSLQSCENIVRLVGYVEEQRDATWLVMKKYPCSLYDLLKRNNQQPLGIGAKALIARDISNGLKHIHQMNIIHLDIKPRKTLHELFLKTSMLLF